MKENVIRSGIVLTALGVVLLVIGVVLPSDAKRTDVYEVIIADQELNAQSVAIIRTTVPPQFLPAYEELEEVVDPALWESFLAANQRPQELPSAITARYRPITLEEFYEIDVEETTVRYFSAIGFNRLSNRALVYGGFTCGERCGTSTLYVIRRSGWGWEIDAVLYDING